MDTIQNKTQSAYKWVQKLWRGNKEEGSSSRSKNIGNVKLPGEKYAVEQISTLVAGSNFVRVAGICGATAVVMGAYGAHAFYPRKDVPDELKQVFETANRYHFLHSLALLAVPLTRKPVLVGTLLLLGMGIFCGSCYIYALTGNKSAGKFTPYGGNLLILGWLTMLL